MSIRSLEAAWLARTLRRVLRASSVLVLLALVPRLATAQSVTRPAGEPANQRLELGPVPGWTTDWHPAPAATGLPLGATVRLRVRGLGLAVPTWRGATEVERLTGGSVAERLLNAEGPIEIAVAWADRDGRPIEEAIAVEVIDLDGAALQVTDVRLAADGLVLDDPDLNAATMRYYFQPSSIAALTEIAPGHYRTSISRWLDLSAEVEPAAFAPLVEWRLDGTVQRHLGSEIGLRVFTAGSHVLAAGPPAGSGSARLDSYLVHITSPERGAEIADGESVTFSAVTEPPGYEDDITWLASTKYGRSDPVTGRGPTFTTRFENTRTVAGHWLGVKADYATLGSDGKGTGVVPRPQVTVEPGKVTVSFTTPGEQVDFEITGGTTAFCEGEGCRAAQIAMRIDGGEPALVLDSTHFAGSAVGELSIPGQAASVTFGGCIPFPLPIPPGFPDPFPFPRPFPDPWPPFPFPCPFPCPTVPVPGGPCDPLGPLGDKSVAFIGTQAGLSTTVVGTGAEVADLAGSCEQPLDEALTVPDDVLRHLQLFPQAIAAYPSLVQELEAAAVESELRSPIPGGAQVSIRLEGLCNLLDSGCVTLLPTAVIGVGVKPTAVVCGAALACEVACIFFC